MDNNEQNVLCSDIPNSEQNSGVIPCFRCGLCCIGPRIHLTLREARSISEYLGIPWQEFEDNYIDPLWLGGDRFLLYQKNGACIFLKQEEGSFKGSCQIHTVRPFSCIGFTPGLYRRQCQAGLAKYWGLTVSPSGHLSGSEDKIQGFNILCSSIPD